jgi:hypothetical protein
MLKVFAVGTSAWARSVGGRGLDDSDGDEIQHATGGIEPLENPHLHRWSWLANASTKMPGDTYDHGERQYSEIQCSRNDAGQQLTIGARAGEPESKPAARHACVASMSR